MIYLVTHYYPPESNPPANRISMLAAHLAKTRGGDEVRVITGRPNHPDGVLPREFRWRPFTRTRGPAGEQVRNLYEFPAPNRGFYRKTLGFASFGASVGLYFAFRRMRKDDVIIVTSPPTFASYALLALSFVRPRLNFVFDVRDLMPQIVAGMGFMSEQSLRYRILLRLSHATYRRARGLIGNSKGICDVMEGFRDPADIALIYNAVDTSWFHPMEPEARQAFRHERPEVFGPEGTTVFLFAGSQSVYMDLHTVIEGFSRVASTRRDWRFLLIGYGEETERLKQQVAGAGLEDLIHFLPYQPRESLLEWLCTADVLCSSRTGQTLFDFVVPTKIIEYLALGKFMLTAHASPFAVDVATRGYSVNVQPEDPDAWCQAVKDCLEHPPPADTGSREWVEEAFSQPVFEQRFDRVLG